LGTGLLVELLSNYRAVARRNAVRRRVARPSDRGLGSTSPANAAERTRLRILQIHNTYRQGGGEDTVADTEAALLSEAGHDVIMHRTANPAGALKATGAILASPWNPLAAREMAATADKTKPDIAHVHNTWFSFSPSVLRPLHERGIRIVMTVHNYRLMCINGYLYRDNDRCTECVGTHPWRGAVHRCYRNSLVLSTVAAGAISFNRMLGTWPKYVDRFISATEYVSDILVRNGIPGDKIRRVSLTVNDPGPRLKPPSASDYVLLVGRLDAQKGGRYLLDKWRQYGGDLELRVIGDGDDRPALEAMGVPNVRFLGWMDPETLYQQRLEARALVFPSDLLETFGLAMVEAFGAGLPVIANDLGTRAEVMGPSEVGWLVRDDAGWESALNAIHDDVVVDRLGAAARLRYETEFAPAATLPKLIEVYEELVGHHAAGH
jgi:glycosyltransferase involved in cell wall biosynthesis